MKVRILEPAFFNNTYLNKGEIVNLNIDECPSWAEVIGEKPKVKELEQKEENGKDSSPTTQNDNGKVQNDEKGENGTDAEKVEDDKDISDEAKKEYLEELLNKAFDKGILLEGTENKTVDEQIAELEELLKG